MLQALWYAEYVRVPPTLSLRADTAFGNPSRANRRIHRPRLTWPLTFLSLKVTMNASMTATLKVSRHVH
jgi:hypothetical protein